MIKKVLLDCTITLLKILIKQYEAGILSYNDLIMSTNIKKVFLEEHISEIENPEEKLVAENIIMKLKNINLNMLELSSISDK